MDPGRLSPPGEIPCSWIQIEKGSLSTTFVLPFYSMRLNWHAKAGVPSDQGKKSGNPIWVSLLSNNIWEFPCQGRCPIPVDFSPPNPHVRTTAGCAMSRRPGRWAAVQSGADMPSKGRASIAQTVILATACDVRARGGIMLAPFRLCFRNLAPVNILLL
jgi:hypothetical protein